MSFLLAISAAGGAAAHDHSRANIEPFLGFWEGIDPFDGSTVQLSVSDIDGDRTLEIVQREGFFSACFDASTNTKGRGKIVGTGSVISRTVMRIETTFTCIDDDNNQGAGETGTFDYYLASHGRYLVQPGNETYPSIVMHRTSQ